MELGVAPAGRGGRPHGGGRAQADIDSGLPGRGPLWESPRGRRGARRGEGAAERHVAGASVRSEVGGVSACVCGKVKGVFFLLFIYFFLHCCV